MPEESLFLSMTEYVALQPGQPYRLFPFGTIHKGGTKREITPEIAAKFKLPHFKPAIKLGSHEEATPSGGSIVGLEVRDDGLYAVPEFTEKGAKALEEGDYRYHPPEVIWEDAGFEDPTTGDVIAGPLIIGDALLHMPHLGEAAALFESTLQEVTMTEEVKVSKSLWEQIKGLFDPQEDETPLVETSPAAEPVVDNDAAPVVPVEQFDAVKAELEQYKANEAKREADRLQAELIGTVKAELAAEEYGGMYLELPKVDEAAGMLASMTAEQREWVQRNFKAYAAHVKMSAVLGEVGSVGSSEGDPKAALDMAVRARMEADHIDYNAAFAKITVEQPDLVKSAGYK